YGRGILLQHHPASNNHPDSSAMCRSLNGAHAMSSPQFKTHEVLNQPRPMAAINSYLSDTPLREAVARHGAAWGESNLSAAGESYGGPMVEFGEQANRNKPVFQPFDRYGRRIDHVEFHPA